MSALITPCRVIFSMLSSSTSHYCSFFPLLPDWKKLHVRNIYKESRENLFPRYFANKRYTAAKGRARALYLKRRVLYILRQTCIYMCRYRYAINACIIYKTRWITMDTYIYKIYTMQRTTANRFLKILYASVPRQRNFFLTISLQTARVRTFVVFTLRFFD